MAVANAADVPLRAFVRLKLRLTANGLRGRPYRKALFVLGVLFAGFFAISGYGLLALPGVVGNDQAAQVLLPLAGTAIVFGWALLPMIFFGVDESLDPARFALLPLPRRTLLAGLTVAVLAGVPALSTLVATTGMVETVARLGGGFAALVEGAGVLAGLLLCVLFSRAVTSAFANALRSRRSRDLAAITIAGLAAAVGPLELALISGAQRLGWSSAATVAAVVGWTPFGAPYSVGLDVLAGRWWAVPLKFVIVAAAGAVLLLWWGSTLEHAMLGRANGRRSTRDEPRHPAKSTHNLLVRGLPRTRLGALVARELRYWWRETRRRASLVTFAIAGLFLPLSAALSGGGNGAELFVGAFATLALTNQFGYDGSGYAANLLAGVPGRLEVRSRAAAHAIYVVPLLAVITVVVGVASGDPGGIAGSLGLILASYGVALGLVLPVSVRAAYALPDTTNPFGIAAGGGLVKGLLAFGTTIAALLGTLPLGLAAHFLPAAWPWLGLPAGVAWGTLAFLAGSHLAGAHLDRRAPELLAAVTNRP